MQPETLAATGFSNDEVWAKARQGYVLTTIDHFKKKSAHGEWPRIQLWNRL